MTFEISWIVFLAASLLVKAQVGYFSGALSGWLRGRGLGHQLLEWAIGECRRRGCEMVQLTADKSRKDALRFYESLGFRALHEGL